MNDSGDGNRPNLGILLRSLSHAGRVADSQLDNALARQGLSIARLGVLKALAESEGPLTLSQIAGRLACVRSNVTQLIDSMETSGLVRRVPDPEDRRSIRAEITGEGCKKFAAGLEEETKVERELFNKLSTEEQAQLQKLLRRFSDSLRQMV